jgi:uncharacterized protein with HEPN domain
MNKLDSVYLFHIRDSINKIIEYTYISDKDSFQSNSMMQDAFIRQIEIKGEASSKLSKTFRDNNSHIPWKNIVGMRNKLIHDYFGVDVMAIWETVKDDIPFLKKNIDEIISSLDQPLNFL